MLPLVAKRLYHRITIVVYVTNSIYSDFIQLGCGLRAYSINNPHIAVYNKLPQSFRRQDLKKPVRLLFLACQFCGHHRITDPD